jgi:pimeloyl-ACP methyl ester carboxylesterase
MDQQLDTHSFNPFNFQTVDNLPSVNAGLGRLMIGAPRHAHNPSLLFVHGAYHGAWCYANYLDFFAQRRIGCAAVDLPGHGGLPQVAAFTTYGVRDLSLCVVQARDAMEGPVVVVGHSMGALPSLLAAALRNVAGVVLLAPSPPSNVPGAQPLPPVPPGAPCKPPTADTVRRRFAGVGEDVDVTPITERLCGESPEVLNDRYLLRVGVPTWAIGVPGLCLEAGRDDAAHHPPGQDKAIADLYGFEYRFLPDAPHCMMYGYDWRTSAEAILEWYLRTFDSSDRVPE